MARSNRLFRIHVLLAAFLCGQLFLGAAQGFAVTGDGGRLNPLSARPATRPAFLGVGGGRANPRAPFRREHRGHLGHARKPQYRAFFEFFQPILLIVGILLLALACAMTTLATGGYSTLDNSIGHFDSTAIDAITTAGMIIGGMPFMLILGLAGGRVSKLVSDSQVRWYLTILFGATAAVTTWLVMARGMEPLGALSGGVAVFPDLRRRMHGVDGVRHEGVPLSGAFFSRPGGTA